MNIGSGSTYKKPANPYIYAGIVAVAVLVLVVLADYPAAGQLGIGAYALLAFWRLGSGQVFKLAIVSLAVMLVSLAMGQGRVASTFSAYAFLLFLVGLFVLVSELWRYSQALRHQKEEENAKRA